MKSVNLLRTLLLSIIGSSALVCGSASGALLVTQVDGAGRTILMGATGVVVGGVVYNVAFKDGLCQDVLSGCTTSSFTFQTEASATLAGQALRDLIRVAPFDFYDLNPGFINGCLPGYSLCNLLTPYQDIAGPPRTILATKFVNYNLSSSVEGVNLFGVNVADNLVGEQAFTWAVWTRQGSQVPEPHTQLMAVLGLGLMGMSRLRRGRGGAGD